MTEVLAPRNLLVIRLKTVSVHSCRMSLDPRPNCRRPCIFRGFCPVPGSSSFAVPAAVAVVVVVAAVVDCFGCRPPEVQEKGPRDLEDDPVLHFYRPAIETSTGRKRQLSAACAKTFLQNVADRVQPDRPVHVPDVHVRPCLFQLAPFHAPVLFRVPSRVVLARAHVGLFRAVPSFRVHVPCKTKIKSRQFHSISGTITVKVRSRCLLQGQ